MSEGEYLYYEGLSDLAEEDAEQRDLDDLMTIGGTAALADEMNDRFLRRYTTAKVRVGRSPKRCYTCGQTVQVGVRRMDYAGKTGRLYWHETCLPPQWFLRRFGWDDEQ